MSQIGDKLIQDLGVKPNASPIVEKALRSAARAALEEAQSYCQLSRGAPNPAGYMDHWFSVVLRRYGTRSTD